MKFNLAYTQGGEIQQYRNLREWLEHKGIAHSFEWNNGKYVADTVVIEDEEDATLFSLTMGYGPKKV
jgi:hypothetical protein